MYLIVKEGKAVGFGNQPETDQDIKVDSDKLYVEAYSLVDGEWVYDNSFPLAHKARRIRNSLLRSTDWTQARDIPDDIALKWQPYRQALRDLTDQAGFPDNITWPSEP